MAITSKTRKELWAKSGNRCAICKKELVNQISEDDGSFIIGNECHIISCSTEGHRYKPGIEDYDSYDNLLLLCKNHHREIDRILFHTQRNFCVISIRRYEAIITYFWRYIAMGRFLILVHINKMLYEKT